MGIVTGAREIEIFKYKASGLVALIDGVHEWLHSEAAKKYDAHNGRFREHDSAICVVFDRITDTTCRECGGTDDMHYLNCSIWPHRR